MSAVRRRGAQRLPKAKASSRKDPWGIAVQSSADPSRAARFLGLLLESTAGAALKAPSTEWAHLLASLFGGSEVSSELLLAHPAWLENVEPERLRFARRKEGMEAEIRSWLTPLLKSGEFTSAFRKVREFKQREMLRVAARDLAGLSNVVEITQEISSIADVVLQTIWEIYWLQFTERYGQPYCQMPSGAFVPCKGCILGMGKLGGQELNYSSDIDVLFVYADEGGVFKSRPGVGSARPALSNHQFFIRLAEAIVSEVSRSTGEGGLFRIDLRLRPEGDSGPLSRSLPSYENYYAQWGQTWERMMLIKARGVAGDAGLAAEFLEMVQPFRYPRSINVNVLREVATMKDRIEREVVRSDELERNVKLGRGGIREIEFIAQSLQLLHAGRQPFLQGSQTLPALQKLAQYELLSNSEATLLHEAYEFLRNAEHRLQMENNLQTHTIPRAPDAEERLARLMGFSTLEAFRTKHREYRKRVREIFEKILKTETAEADASRLPQDFAGNEERWKGILTEHRFREVDKALRVLREFVEGPGYVHVSPRTVSLAHQLLPRLFQLCVTPVQAAGSGSTGGLSRLSDPDRVVTRLDNFIAAYGARSTLFELWNSNPSIFDLLLLLFDRSEFLAELAIRTPDLVDELVTSGRLRQRKTAQETLADLRHGLADADQFLWLRRYHQAELMRIGLRDILGLADFEQYLVELSALADACLQYALEAAMRKHKLKAPPFAIIGLGKLGGAEIDYGSDLDLVFVAAGRKSDVSKAARVAVDVMELMSRRTEQGILFQTDARLRPDGEKGLLVNTLKAYEEYYRNRAQLWEIQSLSRTRLVAGDPDVGDEFQELAAKLTNFKEPDLPLAAYATDWKARIAKMRSRIETERTPKGKDHLAIKTGVGGLMDAEFVAQALALQHGWHEANTVRALCRAEQAQAVPGLSLLIEHYRRLRRIEGILRRWSYEGETVLPEDPAPFYRVSVRCGFETAEDFAAAVSESRRNIRRVYSHVFQD